MTVIYAPRARHEIELILETIAARSLKGSDSVSRAIERTIQSCEQFPRAAARTSRKGVFRKPVVAFKYTVYYRILGDSAIEVLRVRHSARVRNLRSFPRTP